jgi:hypothetical protein
MKLSDIKANPWVQPHVPDMYEGVGKGPYPAPGTFIDHAAEAAMAKVTQVMIDDVPHEVFAAIMAVSKENAALRREVERLTGLAKAADEHRLEVIRWAAAKAAGQTEEPPPGR